MGRLDYLVSTPDNGEWATPAVAWRVGWGRTAGKMSSSQSESVKCYGRNGGIDSVHPAYFWAKDACSGRHRQIIDIGRANIRRTRVPVQIGKCGARIL